MVNPIRFDICLIESDPIKGSETNKTRPCVVISPDSMNLSKLNTIIVAPMTSIVRNHFPTRVAINFNNKNGQIVLDQIRTIDKMRIKKIIGKVSSKTTQTNVLSLLQTMFH